MKHIIIGTAGHIDHGKTTLVEALTGRSTDRLAEEKDRGISIELGFTYFDLPSGKKAGIVDVPGHERFIKNMLAGVMGMDIVLLVVAADEGVMPQTKEHLAILDLLGIDKGFIVLTKSDLVEKDWLELVKEDTRESVQGSFLEDAPIIAVSSKEKKGMDQLADLIDDMALELEDREVDQMPRLPVDRVFSITGFGTIVTGTLLSGKFSQGEEVEIFPKEKLGRIRSLQVHDQDTDVAYAGQRVAMNIAGLKKDQIDRGDVVGPPDSMEKTRMLDVKLKLIEGLDRPIENRSRLRIYIGSKEVLCRLVLLDKEILNPGQEAYAQLRLEEEAVAKRGDKFIARFYSPMFTIGGGDILESNPSKKKRFDQDHIEELKIKDGGESIDIIERLILDKSRSFPTVKEIGVNTGILKENLQGHVEDLVAAEKILVFQLTKDKYLVHKDYFDQVKEEILEEVKNYHKSYPLRRGMSKEEIRSKYLGQANQTVGDRLIDLMLAEGLLEQDKENIRMAGFKVQYNEEQSKIKESINKAYMDAGYNPSNKEEIFKSLAYEQKEIEEVFKSMINRGHIIKLNEDTYIHEEHYQKALKALKSYMGENESIKIADYRDLLDTNRKMALGLLEYFDNLKITKRQGDIRLLIADE